MKTKVKSRKKKVILVIVITTLSLVLLAGGALAAVGISVSNGNTIFPNVTVSGTPVGGLTLEQAAGRLEAPMEAARTNRAVVVEFPGYSILEITAEEAGLAFSGYEAARIAYEFGRDGNIFSNSIAFLRGHVTSADLDPLTLFEADRSMIRSAIQAVASRCARIDTYLKRIAFGMLFCGTFCNRCRNHFRATGRCKSTKTNIVVMTNDRSSLFGCHKFQSHNFTIYILLRPQR